MEWTNDHREWYRTIYLVSDHWIKLRAAKLAKNPKCEVCRKKKSLTVHHINYRNIFDVTLDDLATLCINCHKKEHEDNGMPKREKITYEDYFPLDQLIKLELAKARAYVETKKNTSAGAKILTRNGLNSFYEAVFMLFDGKCFNCNDELRQDKFFVIRQRGCGNLLKKLFACEKCSVSGNVKRVEKTPLILEKFNAVLLQVEKRRRIAYKNFVCGKECDYLINTPQTTVKI